MLLLVEAGRRLLAAEKDAQKTVNGTRARAKLERQLKGIFSAQGRITVKNFVQLRSKFVEAEITDDEVNRLFKEADLATLEVFINALQQMALSGLIEGAQSIIAELGIDQTFSLDNPRAVQYMREHGAEMVTRINQTTKDNMQTLLTTAIENGWSYDQTALAIGRQFKGYYDPTSEWNWQAPRPQGHVDSRAHLIAITEYGNAYETGNAIPPGDLAKAGLTVKKYWSTIGDDRVSEGCAQNEAVGWIAFADAFPSGDQHPLRFPGCRCLCQYDVVT